MYADKTGQSAEMKLLAAVTRELGELLDHDPHFSHRFSRNPFYTGKAPTAYRVMSMRFLDLESSYFVDSESRDFVDAESPRFLGGESTEFLYWC